MSVPARKIATYADLEAVPPHLVAEIIFGTFETHPRPAPRHARTQWRLGYHLAGPFDLGRDGPGGWIFLPEPELHLGDNVVVPDIAGWRRERMAAIPDTAAIELAPDWVCEILSPSTAAVDHGPKRSIYAEAGVQHLWFVDPLQRYIECFMLTSGKWLLAGSATGADDVRLPPFDAIALSLTELFPSDGSSLDPTPQG